MLKDKLKADFKTAMREKNANMKLAVSDIRGAIQYAEIKKGGEIDDTQIIAIINKCVKECNESIDACKTVDYDYSEHEGKLVFFKTYLPEDASIEKILECIDEAIVETDATTMAHMGTVMKLTRTKLTDAGLNFNGGILAANVKSKLG